MIDINKKPNCCGCHACYSICPKKCITMKEDVEGFLYPSVDVSKCINCGLCEKICPVSASVDKKEEREKTEAYAAFNQDEKLRLESSSGGIFPVIAKQTISQGGVVFGAAFMNDFTVKHICVEKETELPKLYGSKYVQSIIGETYSEVKTFLDKGRQVLFSGTPCQVDGLLNFLNKKYDNLLTLDVACHGGPSPLAWKKYLEEKKGKIKKVSFRNKDTGWKEYSLLILRDNEQPYLCNHSDDLYFLSFLLNLSLRPSCYQCHSKGLCRRSDITLADFWGIEHLQPDMDDNKGTSLVLVHSVKGKNEIELIREKLRIVPVDATKAVEYNPSIIQSSKMPLNRKKFFNLLKDTTFSKSYKKSSKVSFIKRLFTKLMTIIT